MPFLLTSIPIALLIAFHAIAMEHRIVLQGKKFTNITHRQARIDAAELDENNRNKAMRAASAHSNGLEAFMFWTAAALACRIQPGLDDEISLAVAIVFLVSRLAYNFIFVWADTEKKSYLRSVVWAISFACSVGLMIRAAVNAEQNA